MNEELRYLVTTFQKILQAYSVIERKPKDFGTGDLLFVSEIHSIAIIGANPEINATQLADSMGVTKGAISQIVKRLLFKRYIVKYNNKNKKVINLSLSDKGFQIFQAHEAFEKRIFGFAEAIYNEASVADRALVKRLFEAIYANTKEMMETHFSLDAK
jgi:DNA-binding MarR family transcriptional regulator